MPDQDIIYSERPPPDDLRPFIHCFWRFRAPQEDDVQPIVPDGRPELIIHLGAPYREADASASQGRIVFAGQLTRPLILLSQGETDIVAARFKPDGARAVLDQPMHHATNRRLDLETTQDASLADLLTRVRTARTDDARFEALTDYVRAKLRNARPDSLVRTGVDAIMQGKDHQPPDGLSLRQYQRRFRAEVGISPRELQSIRRFRSVFNRLKDDRSGNWTERALDAGYFDQPQMARDFRRYLGCTARQWIAQRSGLAREIGDRHG